MSAGEQWTVAESVADVPAAEWDSLVDENDPFLEHAFLAALEESGSIGARPGWLPRFVLVRDGAGLAGAVPLWLKDNSYGEFIFDWAWANGAHRAGVPYFPKLVAAAPFTPVTGPRLLLRRDADRDPTLAALMAGVRAVADEANASSVHFLFCREDEALLLARHGYHPRLSMQFHWANRSPEAYRDFDDFLGAFRSRNRKQVRKERSVATSHGLALETLAGPELKEVHWRALERFYRENADKHDAMTYLTPAFFRLVRENLAHRVVATFASRDGEPVAGSLNFERGKHLYGRYWGATVELPMLHFELCYYQLIDRAIARGYTRFEAGAQGEHKLKRGLDPAPTYSAHWIRHPELSTAVARFVSAEAQAVVREIAEYKLLSPYSRATGEEGDPGG